MANPGGAVIGRIETIPVAVDVQVRRTTENLGVAVLRQARLRALRERGPENPVRSRLRSLRAFSLERLRSAGGYWLSVVGAS